MIITLIDTDYFTIQGHYINRNNIVAVTPIAMAWASRTSYSNITISFRIILTTNDSITIRRQYKLDESPESKWLAGNLHQASLSKVESINGIGTYIRDQYNMVIELLTGDPPW